MDASQLNQDFGALKKFVVKNMRGERIEKQS
jgi:hypothetical protein